MTNTTAATTPYVVDDCRGILQVYSDGSIVRSDRPSINVTVHDDGSVIWKDVTFHPIHGLQLRLYKPASASSSTKLPIFYHIHGGSFCIGSRTWPNCQNYCLRLASDLQAVVISPDYRLPPENRLPAAIEDGFAAVKWLQAQALSDNPDTWLTDVADFNRVFILGDSAGGNIAHHLAVGLGPGSPELAPVRVRGYVFLAAYFGGTVRVKSELEERETVFTNLMILDMFWRLSIPVGETTDHPLVNPIGPASPSLEPLALDPILAVVGSCDRLKDRIKNYVKRLKEWGKKIEYAEFEGEDHGFFSVQPNSEAANKLMQLINRFITENSSN
ncbi:probable carboxylesterase 15 [Macadamia integrifolia]|uniref:probable carboxylesterase 15 n=1 Tax=Macadamia integrifolia TaxID=60698 RepID=UPI001C52D1C3|nr:probable carboxylesterase 15 [Macadamia integrifolia]